MPTYSTEDILDSIRLFESEILKQIYELEFEDMENKTFFIEGVRAMTDFICFEFKNVEEEESFVPDYDLIN